jgi:tRNA-2-methylthio-N6-dimethylallyladenosine synthase
MNFHDSEKIMGILSKKGFKAVENPKEADLIVFNTCSIREKAEQKFYSELGRLKSYKKRNPEVKIIISGCIAQQEGSNILKNAPFVNFVVGPQNIFKIERLLDECNSSVEVDDNPKLAFQELPVKRLNNIKAWVTIMYGCNNFCSYCVVPYTRGPERSRPSKNILNEVLELSENGFKEITLLGQNVNSYNSDIDFKELLKLVHGVGGIKRIRFVTSHPKDLSEDLIKTIADLPKICEHIHLPLQSGSDKILRLMNRGYTFSNYVEKIESLRKTFKDISITTDIIAGFPQETEFDHEQTIKALKEIEFDGIFAFKFSKRPLALASKMDSQIDEDTKSKRLNEILKIQEEITLKKNKLLEGTIQEILIEGESKTDITKLTGRTKTNKIVNIPKNENIKAGDIIRVLITNARQHSLDGIPSKDI